MQHRDTLTLVGRGWGHSSLEFWKCQYFAEHVLVLWVWRSSGHQQFLVTIFRAWQLKEMN